MAWGEVPSCEAQWSQPHQPTGIRPRELLIQEDLGLFVIRDKFSIGVRRVKDLGLSLGTSVCHRGSQHLQNKKEANKKKKKQNAPNAKNLGLMPSAGTLKVSHSLMLFNPLKHERAGVRVARL